MSARRMIFLDVDGVLANWSRAVLELLEVPPPFDGGFIERDIAGWDDIPRLSGVSEDEMWRRIDAASPGFWEDIHPLPGLLHLLPGLLDIAGGIQNLRLLTSPPSCPEGLMGRVRWLQRHLRGDIWPDRTIFCRDKSLLAAPGRILIDDRESTCQVWRARGGQAILYPAPHNIPRGTEGRDALIRCGWREVLEEVRDIWAWLGSLRGTRA